MKKSFDPHTRLCPLCEKEFDIFSVSNYSCNSNHSHYVCHACVGRLVRFALDVKHESSTSLFGQFEYLHQRYDNGTFTLFHYPSQEEDTCFRGRKMSRTEANLIPYPNKWMLDVDDDNVGDARVEVAELNRLYKLEGR
jgi:hypothetical protein